MVGIVLVAVVAVPFLMVIGTVLASWRRPKLGPVDGKLRPCPDSPNCVCSCAEDDEHHIAPLVADASTMNRLKDVLAAMDNVSIVTDDGSYLRAECVTPLLRFVDDLEFLYVADEDVIHVRSASRVGHSDLGANRARVEEIRRRLAQAPEP